MDRYQLFLASIVSAEFLNVGFISSGETLATILVYVIGGLAGGAIGFVLSPFFIKHLWKFTYWVESRLNKMPIYDVLAGSLGLAIGLIISNLIGSALIFLSLGIIFLALVVLC